MQEFVVCDLETTGTEPHKDKIIEIGLVKIQMGKIKDTFQTLINPGTRLPVKIKRLTGLEDHMFENSPQLCEIAGEVINFIGRLPIVGHNIPFDANFLEYHLGVHFPSRFDTLELAKIVYPNAPGHRLADLCKYTGIEFNNQHRALSDALATTQLALKLMDELKKLSLGYLVRVDAFLKQAGSPWASFSTSIIKNRTSRFSGETLNLYYPPPGPEEERKTPGNREQSINEPVSIKKIKQIFSSEGPLSKQLKHFEIRPQQVKMATTVTRALNENKCLLMEAGTGTGKTLAYLIPSLLWTLANGQRTLVATHTINLQDQLWNKDIPILKNLVEKSFSAALVKGRNNYLCLRRWEAILTRQHHLTPQEALFFARILIWLGMTKTGDKNELNLNKQENECWAQICSDPEICQGFQCRWFRRYCFVSRARKRAENADIIITNHSLLFSDLRSTHKILPPFGPLIVDEAHHLEDAATYHFSKQVSRSILKQWVKSIYKTLGKLSELIPPRNTEQWHQLLDKAKQNRSRILEQINNFFDILNKAVGPSDNENYVKTSIRLRPNEKIQPLFRAEGINLITSLKSAIQNLKEMSGLLEVWGATDELWLEHAWILKELIISGNTIADDLNFITATADENHVYWVEISAEGNFNLIAAPVKVGELLFENLLKQNQGIIFTSATLTANESFQYFMERTGVDLLPEDQVLLEVVPSPFKYEQQCILCIDKNMDLPGEVGDTIYFNRLAEALKEYILALQGRTLVLFTSHHALREIYYRLKDAMEERDICLLAHNLDGNRTRLIEQFQNTPRSVLLGSSSFWEGVDIPGPALSNVIIVKLPFWPPNIPVVEARLEELNRNGRNGFNQFSLPQAVIRFKQGFGRLIRTGRDRGSVIIMDKRLITKKYGKIFLNSLPLKTHIQGDTRTIKNKIVNWLENSGHEPQWNKIEKTADVTSSHP